MAMNLANLVTLGNSVSGIFSMFFSIKAQFAQAAYLIYLGMGLDILDGKIARKSKPTQSGKYFDSISDFRRRLAYCSAGSAAAAVGVFLKTKDQRLNRLGHMTQPVINLSTINRYLSTE